MHEGEKAPRENRGGFPGYRPNPLLLALSLLILLWLLAALTGCRPEEPAYEASELKEKFPLAEKASDIPYEIQSRNWTDSPIHSVLYQVKISAPFSELRMCAVAQKIVKETITQEWCHRIAIDFPGKGYVDFAPYGNWLKAGEVPIDNYRSYAFKYTLVQ
jgi:hypothetical protein